jgi:hypothetical protein
VNAAHIISCVILYRMSARLHFFDNESHNFNGVIFDKNGRPKRSMCGTDIECHMVCPTETKGTNKDKLLRKFVAGISKRPVRKYVEWLQADEDKLWFDPRVGLREVHFKQLERLHHTKVVFDMDGTLHQMEYIMSGNLREQLRLWNGFMDGSVTVQDIGECYFGGRRRLARIRRMLQVLRTNVGLRNIYVMTKNKTANVARFIRELYARLFNIRLPSANIIVVAPDELKFTHIRKILDSTQTSVGAKPLEQKKTAR